MKNKDTPYSFSKEFTELCDEVLKDTPLNYFSISRLYKDGTYNALMTDPKWVEHYLLKHYKKTIAPNVTHYETSQVQDFELWSLSSMYGQSADMESLYQDCCLFGYSNGITFVEEFDDCFELYWFSSSCLEGVDRYFLDNVDHLRLLTLQIKEKLLNDPELSTHFDKSFILPNQKGKDDNVIIHKPKVAFEDLKINQFFLNNTDKKAYFTKRETMCLILLVKGYAIKQISIILGLSPRTIETHFNNIKTKTKLSSINEVRKQFTNNKFIRALITTLKDI